MLLLNGMLAWAGALSAISSALLTCVSRLAAEKHSWSRPVLLLSPADARLLAGSDSLLPSLQMDPWSAESVSMLQQLPIAVRSQLAVAWISSEHDLQHVLSLLAHVWRYGQLMLILEPSVSTAEAKRALAEARIKCGLTVLANTSGECPSLCPLKDPLSGTVVRVEAYNFPPMMFVNPNWKINNNQDAISGIHGNIFPILAKAANFSIQINLNEPALSKCVKVATGGIHITPSKNELLGGAVDVTVGQFVSSLAESREIEATTYFYMGCISWFVPRALPTSPLVHLVMPLQPSAWLAVLATLAVVWVAARVSGRLAASKAGLYALSTLLGGSMPTPPAMSRLTLASLRLGCIVLAVAYQSKLSSILTVPTFEQEIDTTEQIVESGLNVGMLCIAHSFFSETSDKNDPLRHIISNIKTIGTMKEGITRVAKNRDMAFMAAKIAAQYGMTMFLEHGPELVHVLRGCSVISPVGLMLRRGDPRVQRLSELVSRVNQAGLLRKWERDVIAGMHLMPQLVPSLSPVTLDHLAGAFVALGMGLMAAAMLWGCELLASRTSRC